MEYKGYESTVEFDEEAELFHGEILNLRDVVTFEGTSVKELRAAFQASVDDYLEFCAVRGEEPEKPFSGRILLRIDPSLHRDLYMSSRAEKKSLNSWIAECLGDAVGALKREDSEQETS